MAKLAEAAGVDKDAKPDALVTALQAKFKAGTEGDAGEVDELRGQVKSLNTQLTQLTVSTAKKTAEAAIDGAIKGGKLVPALRDHMIARHMKDPVEVETELKAMPSLHSGSLRERRVTEEDGALSGDDETVAAMMGLDPKAFAETAKTLERSAG